MGDRIVNDMETDKMAKFSDCSVQVHFSIDGSWLFCYVLGVITSGQVDPKLIKN